MMLPPVRQRIAPLGLAALLLITWACYVPGLSGGFLFDDYVNLDALGATGAIDNWPAFWRYLTSGTADPIGRPLSLLSFLVDARNWPADPRPFLRTNVLLHLLNGVLLYLLACALGRRLGDAPATARWAALLGAGLWMLHPLWVSTVLYAVQREAMLPGTFTLLGLLAYVHGRSFSDEGRTRSGQAWMAGGIVLGTLLATLSKANGILLPMLAWVLEATVLRRAAAGARPAALTTQRWRWLLLVLPSLVVLAYVALQLRHAFADLEHRPWTIAQRLLTEPRVLMDYLQLLAVPRVLSTGLYNDAYQVSTSLFVPVTTAWALLGVMALLGAAFALRRRMPALSAALLFFFAGHVLESTSLPLELYFEHRNYLPALLLFWPLGRAIARWPAAPLLRIASAAALLAIVAGVTWQRASLWGDSDRMALLWAARNPNSARALATAASAEIARGRPDLALRRLEPQWRRRPADLQLALNYANAACASRGLAEDDVGRIAYALRAAPEGDQLVHRWLARAMAVSAGGSCPGLDGSAIDRWLAAAWANPRIQRIPGRRQDLHSLAGMRALQKQQPAVALAEFNRALEAYPLPQAAARQAALLASAGHAREALAHLDHFDRLSPLEQHVGAGMPYLHQRVMDHQAFWPGEIAVLRAKLQAELAGEHAR